MENIIKQSVKETLSTREAAALLGISLRTAQLWVESGVLRAWKTAGGHRRILRGSVEALLKERAEAASAPPGKAGVPEILVVDDDPVLLKVYEAMLRRLQPAVRIVIAQNGYQGLIQMGKSRPHLMITDLEMPGLDGFQMLDTLRRDRNLARMEIIVASGLDPALIERRGGLPAGVAFLPKPVRIDELSRLVQARLDALGAGSGAPRRPVAQRRAAAGAPA